MGLLLGDGLPMGLQPSMGEHRWDHLGQEGPPPGMLLGQDIHSCLRAFKASSVPAQTFAEFRLWTLAGVISCLQLNILMDTHTLQFNSHNTPRKVIPAPRHAYRGSCEDTKAPRCQCRRQSAPGPYTFHSQGYLPEGFLKIFLAAGDAGPGSKADQKCWKLNTLGSSLDQWALRKTRNPHHWEESHLEACSTHSACLSHGNDAHSGTLSSSMMHLAAWLSLHPFPTSPQKILRGLLSKKLLAC